VKIAIIGYGRMGREIEQMALEQGHEVIVTIDNENDWTTDGDKLKSAEVAIEFSMPETALHNIYRCFDAGLAVVSGTTGWTGDLEEIKNKCLQDGHTFFYASNFSPGMNIMFEINKKLAMLMAKHPSYRILIEEIHHSEKKDSPSGTAISLAGEILTYHPVKEKWVNVTSSEASELEIISHRRDQVAGTHLVRYDSEVDSLEIKHTAHSRKGFVLGALLAAEWLIGKSGCFSMPDMLYDKD